MFPDFSGGVVGGLLCSLHPGYVDCEGATLVTGGAGEEAKMTSELPGAGRVLVDVKLDALAELPAELLVAVLIFRGLPKKFHALHNEVLADDLDDLVLLGHLRRDAQGRILGINDFLDKGILVDAKFDVLAELLVGLLVAALNFRGLPEKFHVLLDDVLAGDLEDPVLLEHLKRDVQRRIFRVNDSLGEVEVVGDEFLAVVHNEDTMDLQLEVALSLLVIDHDEGGALGDGEKGVEL